MSSLCTSNVTSGFIDLATYDELEKYMYGGCDATAYFVRETRKSTWFTQVPVCLSRSSGSPAFGTEWSVSISRAGDYLLSTWLRVTLPKITPNFGENGNFRIRWTRNLMHNLVKECCITFNDLVAARFDSFHLDFWAAFTVPASKKQGYSNMIGDFPELISPYSNIPGLTSSGTFIPETVLNLPLPFFFSRDSGVALPTAALPYNDMKIQFSFREYTDLLIVDDLSQFDGDGNPTGKFSRSARSDDVVGTPTISNAHVWANYAIVSNEERKRMACHPRDILIEQVQSYPRQNFLPETQTRYDLRFSHAIKVLFFAARNSSVPSQWSNYTTASPVPSEDVVDFYPDNSHDPISQTSIIYENTNRLAQMGSDYFSCINPWYHAPSIPSETGYHMYSYSLDFISLDPMGSTNYGKLTNISIVPEASQDAKDASKAVFPQTWDFITTAINNNIIRISGGALGFPVL